LGTNPVITANSNHGGYFASTGTASATYSVSAFMKAGTGRYFLFRAMTDTFATRYGVTIDLQTGTILSSNTQGSPTGTTSKIEDFGNGWYRVTLTINTIGTLISGVFGASNTATPTLQSDLDFSYTGNGTDSYYMWGMQIENSSYSTSYIPTTSASATRVVDGGYKFGISSLIGQSEGTIFLNYTLLNNSTDDITIGITGNNGKIIWFRKNGIQFYGNGTTLLFDASSAGTMGLTYKIAFVYGQSDFRLYINGVSVGTATSGTFTGTFDDFTFFPVGSVPYTNANKINEMVFFPNKLTNAELASLTTI
jgi:hypothetical protein